MGVKVRLHHGQYYVFVNHKRRRKAFAAGDKASATKLADSLRAKLHDPDFRLKAPGPAHTLTAFSERWLRDHAEQVCKASTVRGYKDNLDLHILPVLGTALLSEITRADCKTLLKRCRDKGLRPKSLSNIARTLSTVLTEAVEEGLIPNHPAFRLGRYCANADALPFKISPFTRDECILFLKAAIEHTPRHYPLFLAALRTGMRQGELLGLQWGDIDFKGRYLTVRRNRVRGKTTSPKNGRTRRVDMSQQLTEELQRLLVARKAEKLREGWKELPPWVFVTRDGTPMDEANVRHHGFYKALSKSGLRDVRFHDLRHTYASLLIQAGESLAYVKDQLGHSSIKITVDIYGHLIPGANRAAVDRLDDCSRSATSAQPGAEADLAKSS